MFVAVCLLAFAVAAQAQFSYITYNGAIGISGYTGSGGMVTIPSTINGLPVKFITSAAFRLSNLSGVSIPTSVTDIAPYAFEGCTNLTSVTLPGSITNLSWDVFSGCSSLTNAVFSEGILTIGGGTFEDCGSLVSVTIPDSVTNIGGLAFLRCGHLTTVKLGSGLTQIDSDAFYNCTGLASIIIPTNVTRIGAGAFSWCPSLTNVVIPATVTSIDTWAFGGCPSLPQITLPTNLVTLGECAFSGCSNLCKIQLPPSLTSIADRCFSYCAALTNVTVSAGIASIGTAAFANCVSLEGIELPNTVTNVGEAAFYMCSRLQAITIPGSVSSVGPYAFYYCTSLNRASISNGVQGLGAHAFEGCVNLLGISIPASVGSIGAGLMADCDGLRAISVDRLSARFQSVDGILFDKAGKTLLQYPPGRTGTYSIPNSVARVGDFAFFGCGRLEGITIPTSVAAIGESAFDSCSALTNLFIPASVTSIGALAFRNCINVSAIDVDSLNPAYSSVEGVLFDKNQTTLIQYPPAKSGNYTVPKNVVTIENWAFSHCPGLTNLTIDYVAANVGDAAFWGCENLRTIYFLGNAPKPGSDSFADGNDALIYHVPTTTGWSDTLGGRPVSLWSPLLRTTDREGGMQTNGFEFSFSGPAGLTVVIEASTNLGPSSWFPIGTNTLTGELAHFTDRGWTNSPYHFYRVRWALPDEYLFSFGITNGAATITRYLGTNAEVNVPGSIIDFPVVSIGSYAFAGARGLRAVTLPNGVTNIGVGAFETCYDLTNVVMPNTVVALGDYAFLWCQSLQAIVLSSNLTSIGYSTFNECAALREIVIPNSVTSLGQSAFGGCTALASVTLPTNVAEIPAGTFGGCHALADISVPNSVTNIGAFAFDDCWSLSTLSLPANLRAIEYSGFDGCIGLTNVEINSRTLSLGGLAFGDCTSLSSIHFGAALTNLVIGSGSVSSFSSFSGSTNLSTVTVDPLNSSYSTVDGVLFDKTAATLVLCPAGRNGVYVVPEGVTNIASRAFYGCSSLTGVTISSGVETIGADAFGACRALSRVVISDGVITIGDGAFANCSGLTSIILGRGVASIGNAAFSFCFALKEIYFRGNAPAAPSPNFYQYNNAVVYYLPGTTGWSTTFAGLPTVQWNPQIATGMPNFGFGTNGFEFTVTGPSNLVFVVEACTNLAQLSWFAVSTNTLTGGSAHFSDPSSRDSASRFYRLRSP